MKIKQLLTWLQDNNVDDTIDQYIKTNPKTLKTINLIESYIVDEFVRMNTQQEEIGKRMFMYKGVDEEDAIRMLEDQELLILIGNTMEDLDMIATYIEKHKPE